MVTLVSRGNNLILCSFLSNHSNSARISSLMIGKAISWSKVVVLNLRFINFSSINFLWIKEAIPLSTTKDKVPD